MTRLKQEQAMSIALPTLVVPIVAALLWSLVYGHVIVGVIALISTTLWAATVWRITSRPLPIAELDPTSDDFVIDLRKPSSERVDT